MQSNLLLLIIYYMSDFSAIAMIPGGEGFKPSSTVLKKATQHLNYTPIRLLKLLHLSF